MKRYIVYSQDKCKYCTLAKQLLGLRGLPFQERTMSDSYHREVARSLGFVTMPQIFEVTEGVGTKLIGGYTELAKEFGVVIP